MPLIRRHAAVEGIEIDLAHRRRPAAFGHGEPLIELRREARPRRAEPRIDAARSPFLCPLADLVGREEPARLGAGQFRFVRRSAAMGEADTPRIFHLIAEVSVQFFAQAAVAGHVDISDRRIRRDRCHGVIGHDLVVAAERFHERDIEAEVSPTTLIPLRPCRRCARPNAVLLEADESITRRAP